MSEFQGVFWSDYNLSSLAHIHTDSFIDSHSAAKVNRVENC